MKPEESLAIVQEIIDKSRKTFVENGHLYLVWGWLSLIISILHYVLIVHYQVYWGHAIWFAMILGTIYQSIWNKKNNTRKSTTTFVDNAMKYTWTAFLGGIFFIIVTMPAFEYQPYSFFILFYGVATYISGGLLKFKPLQIGGILSLLIAIVCAYVDYEWQMLLLSLDLVVAYIIPGLILQKNPVSHV